MKKPKPRKPKLETPPEAAIQWAYRWSVEWGQDTIRGPCGDHPEATPEERSAYVAGFMRGNAWRAGREARKRKWVRL